MFGGTGGNCCSGNCHDQHQSHKIGSTTCFDGISWDLEPGMVVAGIDIHLDCCSSDHMALVVLVEVVACTALACWNYCCLLGLLDVLRVPSFVFFHCCCCTPHLGYWWSYSLLGNCYTVVDWYSYWGGLNCCGA